MARERREGAREESALESSISFEEFSKKRKDPSVDVLDVRVREAYLETHVAGAIHLPVAHIEDGAHAMLPDRDREIIVYCGSPG